MKFSQSGPSPFSVLDLQHNILHNLTGVLWFRFSVKQVHTSDNYDSNNFPLVMVTILSRTTHCAKWPACTLSQNLGESRRSHCQGPHSPKLAASVRGRGKPLLWPLPGCPEIPHESIITETEIFSNLDVYVNHMYYMHVSRAAGFQIL